MRVFCEALGYTVLLFGGIALIVFTIIGIAYVLNMIEETNNKVNMILDLLSEEHKEE